MAQSAWSQQTKSAAPAPGDLPVLHLPAIDPRLLPRPPDVIRAVYKFAAERPEVVRYVPCFCGCQETGHRSSEDCFVKSRSKNGTVTEWNEHGIACAMCIAVVERAKTMCDAGASMSEVRADIEKRYGQITGSADRYASSTEEVGFEHVRIAMCRGLGGRAVTQVSRSR